MRSNADDCPAPAAALFDRVYAEHQQALHAYFLGRTGDPEAALDLLQEAFLRVWRHLPSLQAIAPGEQRYWLFTVARSALTDHYRRQATRLAVEQDLDDDAGDPAPTADEPAGRLLADEELALLDRAIGRLPADLRTPLLMQVLGEMTSGQIGQALGKPAGTIRYQISLARRRLLEEMQGAGAHGVPESDKEEAGL